MKDYSLMLILIDDLIDEIENIEDNILIMNNIN